MTAHYRLDADAAQIAQAFDADARRDPWSGGYVTPNRPAPVILCNKDGDRYLAPRIWGVPPHQSFSSGITDPRDYRPVTTVRNTQSPFWIGNLRHIRYRCMIPVTAFQIWSSHPDPRTGRKTPHWFHLPAEPIFAFAAIWRDSEVASFAILTTDVNDCIASVNPSGMPVILSPEDQDRWMDSDWQTAQSLVRTYPDSMIEEIKS